MDRNAAGPISGRMPVGQVRKSLWIETLHIIFCHFIGCGQARKSLWIETKGNLGFVTIYTGQARKSLWIET